MQRYPTENGLAIPITEIGYEMMPESSRRTQGHHLYFEKEWYMQNRVRSVFRNLVGHVARMRPVDHQELHNRFGPPAMLRDWKMVEHLDNAVEENGLLIVHKERKLRETYQIQVPEWEHIRSGHGKTIHQRRN